MNVAWIVYGSLEQRTGGTIYDAIVVAGLRSSGDEVHVLDARSLDAASLVRAIASLRPDVIVGDELCHRELSVVFAHCVSARRVLLVHHLTCWEDELTARPRAIARFFESRVLRHADIVVTTSAASRDRLLREGWRAPIQVVLPGADRLARFSSQRRGRALEGSPIELLFAGAITPRKRVLDLVCALPSSGVRLTVVGSRDRDPFYARRVERAAAADVRFTGELSDADLAGALAASDALVLPSSLEGYGIVATEALYAGVPVLAARTPGLVEALAPCPSASLFFAPTELAPSLVRLGSERTLLTRMQDAARSASSVLPTWEDCIASFRAVTQLSFG